MRIPVAPRVRLALDAGKQPLARRNLDLFPNGASLRAPLGLFAAPFALLRHVLWYGGMRGGKVGSSGRLQEGEAEAKEQSGRLPYPLRPFFPASIYEKWRGSMVESATDTKRRCVYGELLASSLFV